MSEGFPENGRQRVLIEAIEPALAGGTYAVKRVVGDRVTVSADLIADGHDVIAGELCVRKPVSPGERPAAGAERSVAIPLEALGNDRFSAAFVVDALG